LELNPGAVCFDILAFPEAFLPFPNLEACTELLNEAVYPLNFLSPRSRGPQQFAPNTNETGSARGRRGHPSDSIIGLLTCFRHA